MALQERLAGWTVALQERLAGWTVAVQDNHLKSEY